MTARTRLANLDATDWFLIVVVAANAAALFLLPISAFVWQIVVDLMLAAGVFAYLYLAADDRAERTAAELLTAEFQRDEARAERDIATALVDQLRADLRAARPLHAVPAQRDGSEWSRIARVLDIEEGEHA